MRISELKKTARISLSGFWAETALLTFIVFLIYEVPVVILEVSAAGGLAYWMDQPYPPFYVYPLEWAYGILLIPLSVGVLWYYLSLVREENPRITRPFAMYLNPGTSLKMVGASLLLGLFVFLWLLVFIVPGLIKTFSYSQTFYILRDHPEYSVLEAITESKKRMKGYKWKLFLLNLSFIGWAILAIISFMIGFLWLAPYIAASNTAFYDGLIKHQEKAASIGETPDGPITE